MSNYKIILDKQELYKFIAWLPELQQDECYYLALFARKKYHESAKNDKSQCKRVTATSKEWLLRKIKQLEIKEGAYTNKDGSSVHNDSLALYISVNPRSFKMAQKKLIIRLVKELTEAPTAQNPSSLALSEIQKSKSRTVYVDFDYDGISPLDSVFEDVINLEACTIIHTRGGFHLLVDPTKVSKRYKAYWYKCLSSIKGCDTVGDNLIPVVGCSQGGFTPRLEL